MWPFLVQHRFSYYEQFCDRFYVGLAFLLRMNKLTKGVFAGWSAVGDTLAKLLMTEAVRCQRPRGADLEPPSKKDRKQENHYGLAETRAYHSSLSFSDPNKTRDRQSFTTQWGRFESALRRQRFSPIVTANFNRWYLWGEWEQVN